LNIYIYNIKNNIIFLFPIKTILYQINKLDYCPCFEDSYSFFSFFDGIAIGSWLDKKYFGNESPVKSYTIKYGKVLGLKDYLKKEPPVYQNMKKSFLRYGFLNDLYDIFGIKSILLVRFIIGNN